jgi:FkbM family methyltransferase
MYHLYFFKKANILFKKAYPLYRMFYFLYKNLSERKRIKYMKTKITPGMCVLDIGANIGFYTSIFSKAVGHNGIVYSFEPDRINFLKLEGTIKGKPNVVAVNSAVGNKSGFIDLFMSDDLNVDHHTYDDGEGRERIRVPCVSIDDFIGDKQSPSFVKIDIQGYDFHAIQGMVKTISKAKNMVIFGEFWPYGLNRSGISPEIFYNILVENAFRVEFMDKPKTRNQIFELINDKYHYTDFIAEKSSWRNEQE